MGGPAVVDGKRVKSTDNFLIAPFVIDGVAHASAEHYYQYAKFDRSCGEAVQRHCEAVRLVPDATTAWSLGQVRQHALIENFEERKAGLMYRAVRAKYHQHPGLADELVSTVGPIRAAVSTSNWQVVNSLILERVRTELRIARGATTMSSADVEAPADLVESTGGACWTEQDAREAEWCSRTGGLAGVQAVEARQQPQRLSRPVDARKIAPDARAVIGGE